MSSEASQKLYCLNTDHIFPGNEFEEHRILRIFNHESKRMNMSDKKDFNEFINSLVLNDTRVLGPPKLDNNHKYFNQLMQIVS